MKSCTYHDRPFSARQQVHPKCVRGRTRYACVAQQASTASPSNVTSQQFNPLLMGAVEALFRFPPFFNAAAKNARTMIVKRAESLGLDWNGAMRELQSQDWDRLMQELVNPAVQYPEYYTQPFHAYSKGNLCWEAALEVTMAAVSVHANVMDPAGKTMDPKGDHMLRSTYGARMLECLAELGVEPTRLQRVVDVGCATGLSSLALLELLPHASITGLDLSPHFLAVGRFQQRKREAASGKKEPITLLHAAAEASSLPSQSQDLVSICLVCHELPQHASKAIFKEAYRVLRPGGVLAIMEMNPQSSVFQRIFGNPFAYTAFKSTEPWLQEYLTLDMHGAIQEAGFSKPVQKENTPRHRTVVAVKHA